VYILITTVRLKSIKIKNKTFPKYKAQLKQIKQFATYHSVSFKQTKRIKTDC